MIRKYSSNPESPLGSDTITATRDWRVEITFAQRKIHECDKALTLLSPGERLYRKYTALKSHYIEYLEDCTRKVGV